MRRIPKALVLLSLLGTFSCGEPGASISGLRDTAWQLVALVRPSGTEVPVADPNRFTVRFEADGSALVRADCNTCFSSWSATGSALSLGPLACTKMFCGEESLDREYLTTLGKARSFERDQDRLTIDSLDGVLRFRRSPGLESGSAIRW